MLENTFSMIERFLLRNNALVSLALVLMLRPSTTRVVPEPGLRLVGELLDLRPDDYAKW